jgi:hypothetical protein
MSPEVLAQAGVLFFTTKPHGQGTGLGLAGARGFAERAGGALCIESELGRGTTVALLLPACRASETEGGGCQARPGTPPLDQASCEACMRMTGEACMRATGETCLGTTGRRPVEPGYEGLRSGAYSEAAGSV